ncbi:hypothetical protein C8Q75DRAFT_567363 [Abortiporus biennis]|nr:hypothetical protein C8Q75DRAFT_567363 [Abortiporus biennis]
MKIPSTLPYCLFVFVVVLALPIDMVPSLSKHDHEVPAIKSTRRSAFQQLFFRETGKEPQSRPSAAEKRPLGPRLPRIINIPSNEPLNIEPGRGGDSRSGSRESKENGRSGATAGRRRPVGPRRTGEESKLKSKSKISSSGSTVDHHPHTNTPQLPPSPSPPPVHRAKMAATASHPLDWNHPVQSRIGSRSSKDRPKPGGPRAPTKLSSGWIRTNSMTKHQDANPRLIQSPLLQNLHSESLSPSSNRAPSPLDIQILSLGHRMSSSPSQLFFPPHLSSPPPLLQRHPGTSGVEMAKKKLFGPRTRIQHTQEQAQHGSNHDRLILNGNTIGSHPVKRPSITLSSLSPPLHRDLHKNKHRLGDGSVQKHGTNRDFVRLRPTIRGGSWRSSRSRSQGSGGSEHYFMTSVLSPQPIPPPPPPAVATNPNPNLHRNPIRKLPIAPPTRPRTPSPSPPSSPFHSQPLHQTQPTSSSLHSHSHHHPLAGYMNKPGLEPDLRRLPKEPVPMTQPLLSPPLQPASPPRFTKEQKEKWKEIVKRSLRIRFRR